MTVLGSGSAGNATLVRLGGTALLIDAGLSARQIERRLRACGEDPAALAAILVSHEHGDHVRGAAVLSRRFRLPVFCAEDSLEAAGPLLEGLWGHEPLAPGRRVAPGGVEVTPFPLPHDAVSTLGFVLRGEGLSVAYATDLGHANRLVVQRLRGAHVLVLEMNHDPDMVREGPYPWPVKQRVLSRHGHLSNDAAAELLPRVADGETEAILLAHISETNNDRGLALATAREALDGAGRAGVALHLTWQDRPSRTVRL